MLLSPAAEALLFDKKGSVLPGPASPDRNMKHENNGIFLCQSGQAHLDKFSEFSYEAHLLQRYEI